MFKKLIFFISIVLGATASSVAQNGLENIVVEKYYVSNAADEANANTALGDAGYTPGTLPVGSVTWRIYADLLPGWGVQAVYGVSNHPLPLPLLPLFSITPMVIPLRVILQVILPPFLVTEPPFSILTFLAVPLLLVALVF